MCVINNVLIYNFPLACETPLGMENYDIPDHALVTSGTHYNPIDTRLNKPAFFLLPVQVDEYVQVDLGPGGKSVSAITMRGHFAPSNVDWISKFVLNYSRDGCEFLSYMENGAVKVLPTLFISCLVITRFVPLES